MKRAALSILLRQAATAVSRSPHGLMCRQLACCQQRLRNPRLLGREYRFGSVISLPWPSDRRPGLGDDCTDFGSDAQTDKRGRRVAQRAAM